MKEFEIVRVLHSNYEVVDQVTYLHGSWNKIGNLLYGIEGKGNSCFIKKINTS